MSPFVPAFLQGGCCCPVTAEQSQLRCCVPLWGDVAGGSRSTGVALWPALQPGCSPFARVAWLCVGAAVPEVCDPLRLQARGTVCLRLWSQ